MAVYAIGDIQGCMSSLTRLLDRVGFTPDVDRLWLVGDLVNRGPDSLSVLRYIKALGKSADMVLGNHDIHLLAVAAGVTPLRKKDTLHEILAAPDRDELLTWLRRQPLLHEESGYVLVHAGLLPQWTVGMAVILAREAENELRGTGYRDLLYKLYEDGLPRRWSENLTGMTKAAVITNVLTKLRVCTIGGEMDFSYKAGLEDIPTGLFPWFKIPGRRNADTTVICGHWAALGLHLQDNIIAIDTGCVWGRQLTAVDLDDRRPVQMPCAGSPQ